MRRCRTLKFSLFVSPSLIIIGAFAIILLAFNIIVSQYTNRIASEHIHSQFSTFSLYSKNEENWKITKNESGYGLTTAYVVLDESEKAIDPSPPWLNPEEEAMVEYIRVKPIEFGWGHIMATTMGIWSLKMKRT